MTTSYNLNDQDYGGAFAILDEETLAVVNEPLNLHNINTDKDLLPSFLDKYEKWIKSTVLNELIGLEQFPFKVYSNGTTESFDKFFIKHKDRRFRFFPGEYVYHKLAMRSGYNFQWITALDIQPGDAVIISLPFSDTGEKHSMHDAILEQCNKHNVPVLIDCCYFGTCSGLVFNFSHPCITDVVFSLSKPFPVAFARIGIRFTREDDDDLMFVYDKMQYVNKVGCILGSKLLDKFSPDYIPTKYHNIQAKICTELDVIPSSTVLFGIGGQEWAKYNRGGPTNRLSVFKQFLTYGK